MRCTNLAAGLLFLLILSGCSSPPVRFHTLMQPAETGEPAPNQISIHVDSVSVPAPVDRTELVVRQGPTDLLLLSSDWWGASLSEEIRSALTARLAGTGQEETAFAARIEVTRFDVRAGQGAWLEARYRLRSTGSDDRHSLTCATRLYTEAESRVESLVQAQQTNLEALARQMLVAAKGLTAGNNCPS
ncbi:MAG: membrane integrity-associated transporter subunit PqiC [Oleiphilaceae bacterium]|nr:membrane integrity-associated transporter subunit PqiC [Oleiphilaceae bacterium]